MAGHSKWANRKHRKERQDAKKGKIFSKMAKEITVAVKEGGPDPEANARLRLAIEKAKAFSVPAENIERAIQRGSGGQDSDNYEELIYEGYGPGGSAIMLQILTDNRNRTAAEIRHIFSRNGGNLGETGCVAWMFKRKGLLVIDRQAQSLSEEDLLLLAAEAGAEDVKTEEEVFEIYTSVDDLESVRRSLEEGSAIQFADVELTMVPNNEVEVQGKEAEQLLRLLDALEDHDDVQEVYHNASISEEALNTTG